MKSTSSAHAVIEAFRCYSPTMSLNAASVLLLIGELSEDAPGVRPGLFAPPPWVHQRDVLTRSGLQPQTLSGTLGFLAGATPRKRDATLEAPLIELAVDLEDRRCKLLRLTGAGRDLVARVAGAVIGRQ